MRFRESEKKKERPEVKPVTAVYLSTPHHSQFTLHHSYFVFSLNFFPFPFRLFRKESTFTLRIHPMITQEQLKSLQERVSGLRRYL